MPASLRSLRLRAPSLRAPSLRWRLAAWVTVVVVVCTGVTFAVVYDSTGTQLRQQIDRELTGDASGLAHSLIARGSDPRRIATAAARYIKGQPFKPSSTLLFATVPGVGTSSNQPELLAGSAPDSGESAVERAREARLSVQLRSARSGYSTLAFPDVGELRLLKRTVTLRAGPTVTVGVAQPLSPVAHAQRSVAQAFIFAGLLALAGALLASWLIGTRVSRPLRRMAAVATRVDAGDLDPRIGDVGAYGGEVRVLAEAFDRMLDRLRVAFDGQRAFVADASHELRTPLTVIRGQIEVLGAQREPSGAEVRRVERAVRAEIARITRLVDDLLLLAKSEQTEFLRPKSIDVASFVRELWEGATSLGERRFVLEPLTAGRLQGDPDRVAQALRNLIANAIQHTAPSSGLVRMRVQREAGGRLCFSVEDDGPGIPAQERERVFDRFHRLDAARDRASGGTGLGLAIVRAIALAHGGGAWAEASPLGGARLVLELPRFEAVREPARRPSPASASAQDAGVSDRVAARLGPHA